MFVAFFAVGEGWHNYHHAFPWDYRASELGTPLNMTGFLIDVLAKFGFIYDRKEASHNMVKNRVMRTGDSSHKTYGTKEGRSAFTTLFNMWPHPLNPTYNSIYSPKPKIINENGYALIPSELHKNELDEELLSKEIAEMEKQQQLGETEPSDSGEALKKYIVEKKEANKIIGDLSKYILTDANNDELYQSENLNNNEPLKKTKLPNGTDRSYIPKDKNQLNVVADEAFLVK